jgi:hypothetical protein
MELENLLIRQLACRESQESPNPRKQYIVYKPSDIFFFNISTTYTYV